MDRELTEDYITLDYPLQNILDLNSYSSISAIDEYRRALHLTWHEFAKTLDRYNIDILQSKTQKEDKFLPINWKSLIVTEKHLSSSVLEALYNGDIEMLSMAKKWEFPIQYQDLLCYPKATILFLLERRYMQVTDVDLAVINDRVDLLSQDDMTLYHLKLAFKMDSISVYKRFAVRGVPLLPLTEIPYQIRRQLYIDGYSAIINYLTADDIWYILEKGNVDPRPLLAISISHQYCEIIDKFSNI